MSNQPPYGYDPQQPYEPGQASNYGGATGQEGSAPQGNPQPGYPPPPYPPQYAQPGSYSQQYGQPPYGYYGMPGAVPRYDDKAGFAIAGLVLGILSLLLFCATVCDAPFFVLGLIFSYLGLQSTTQRNLAVAGLVMSGVGLLLAIGLFGLATMRGAFHYYYFGP